MRFCRYLSLPHNNVHIYAIVCVSHSVLSKCYYGSQPRRSQGLRRSYARIALLTITVTMFAISTAHLILSMILYLMQWPYICATVAPDGYFTKIYRLNMAISVMSRAQYLISDAVVVWRAWAVWYDNRWVRGSLLFSLLGTAGTRMMPSSLSTSVRYTSLRTVTSIFLAVLNVLSDKTHHQYPTLEQNMLGTFALLFTNFGATIAIAVKAWYVDSLEIVQLSLIFDC